MTNKTYILNIPNPCLEKWDKMLPQDRDKFCMQCSKKVFDFTGLNNAEIIQIIEQSKGRICGRMSQSQLNRPVEIQPKTKNKSKLYKALAGVFLIGTTGNAFTTNPPLIEPEILSVTSDNNFQPHKTSFDQSEIDSLKNIIQGQVFNEYKQPVYDAYIYIEDMNISTEVDYKGNFKIVLPNDLSVDSITLKTESIGCKPYTLNINRNDLPVAKEIYLINDEEEFIIGEIIYLKKIRWWQFWKRL